MAAAIDDLALTRPNSPAIQATPASVVSAGVATVAGPLQEPGSYAGIRARGFMGNICVASPTALVPGVLA